MPCHNHRRSNDSLPVLNHILLSLSPVNRHVIMDMLTRRPSPLEYSLETAHTIEVSREEDENGEFGSFGFTLLNEKPPNVGTIVPGMALGEIILGWGKWS